MSRITVPWSAQITTLGYAETTSAVTGVSSVVALSSLAAVTVTVGNLPINVEAFINMCTPSAATTQPRMTIEDELSGLIAHDRYVAAGTTDTRSLKCARQLSYAAGTIKTFTVFVQAATTGTCQFGTTGLGVAAYLKVTQG